MKPVRVKICGITSLRDAITAIDAGADALGFNTWPGSKRFVDPKTESGWIAGLPPFVSRIAVTVAPGMEQLEELARLAWVDSVQLHGEETPEFCKAARDRGIAFYKAIGVRDAASLNAPERFCSRALLLDVHAPGEFGGTGRTIDWELAAEFVRNHPDMPVVLSGGLTPENVGEAVRQVRPYGVDVASGVEQSPRRKDADAIRAFIEAARTAE